MNWIEKLLKRDKVDKLIPVSNTPFIIPPSEWIEFAQQKPPHKVVLAACNTHDCGWIMDTAWWYEDKKCWMVTGSVESLVAHLPYSHWRNLPPYPNL